MENGATNVSNMQNTAPKKRRPSQNFLKSKINNKESLKSCGFAIIDNTLTLTLKNEQGNDQLWVYMDEMLHSIFFLGHICDAHLTPIEFFKKPTVREFVMKNFPEPFKKYRSHLPTRTPFSILLNVMEVLYHTEEKIMQELRLLLKQMEFPYPLHQSGSVDKNYYTLESTVICVCSSGTDPQKYYGASLSCRTKNAKRILIDISCLKTWHECVSHAVMSFTHSTDGITGDGITFPESVRCQAYIRDWNENVYRKRAPCLNCKHLFNLQDADPDKVHHPYGNCAETECLSKLLVNDQVIRQKTRIENHTKENLQTLRDKTKESLRNELNKVSIQMENFPQFYRPSVKVQ